MIDPADKLRQIVREKTEQSEYRLKLAERYWSTWGTPHLPTCRQEHAEWQAASDLLEKLLYRYESSDGGPFT